MTLASLRGRPVLVNLWASWCEPCQAEVPTLAKLHRRGLQVVGISVDPKAETARRTVTSERMPYAVWHDPGNRSSAVFGAPALPASFLLDARGRLMWSSQGALAEGDPGLEAALRRAAPRTP